jgi:hypothetical protein
MNDNDTEPQYTAVIDTGSDSRFADAPDGIASMEVLLAQLTEPGMQLIITRV